MTTFTEGLILLSIGFIAQVCLVAYVWLSGKKTGQSRAEEAYYQQIAAARRHKVAKLKYEINRQDARQTIKDYNEAEEIRRATTQSYDLDDVCDAIGFGMRVPGPKGGTIGAKPRDNEVYRHNFFQRDQHHD